MLRLDHVEPALRREPLGQAAGELGRHVLHDQDRGLLPGRQRRHHLRQRARAAGGGGDGRALPRAARQREQRLHVGAARGARQHGHPEDRRTPHRPEHAEQPLAEPSDGVLRLRSSSLATRSTAPSSSARMAAAVPGPAYELTTTIGPRRLRHDVADGAEAIELGHLEVHEDQVGRLVMHLLQRVHPVPRGAHDPELAGCPSTTSVSSRRKKGLSSTTRTDAPLRGSGHHAPPTRPRPGRPTPTARTVRPKSPPVASPMMRHAHGGGAPGAQATTLRSPIWMVPGAPRLPNMLAPPTSRAVIAARCWRRAAPSARGGAARAVCGNLAGLLSLRAQRRRRQQHVRHAADARRGVVEHDRDAAAEADGDQHVRRLVRPEGPRPAR